MMYQGKNKGFVTLGLRGLNGPAGGADFEQFCSHKRDFSTDFGRPSDSAPELVSR